jgi:fructosamine-3-kinase
MAGEALRAGRLPVGTMRRIEQVAGRLETWIDEPARPGLIHGDAWGGNILCRSGRVAGFIDPALYYADPEIELAFGTLFGTFGEAFFDRYREFRPIAPGFEETRRPLYLLYPLLVHVRLFGGGYVGSVDRILDRFSG